jgi:hypothetical protein
LRSDDRRIWRFDYCRTVPRVRFCDIRKSVGISLDKLDPTVIDRNRDKQYA